MKVTINGKRYDLSTMIALGCSSRWNRGIRTTEVYFGPRSHRLIRETDSIWNDGTGCVTGVRYHVIEPRDTFDCAGFDWVQEMQWALDRCEPEHEEVLQAAMDEHAPALEG